MDWVIGAVVVLVIVGIPLWGVAIYNRLILLKNRVEEGWSGIDVQLKRRANLIPNLIETVKGYVGHERGLLNELTELRSKSAATSDKQEIGTLEQAISTALGNLLAVAEDYPDLKANENFLDLQGQLQEIEDQIQLARRYYNATVRDINTLIESFPSLIVARMFAFQKAVFFEIDDPADHLLPKVKF